MYTTVILADLIDPIDLFSVYNPRCWTNEPNNELNDHLPHQDTVTVLVCVFYAAFGLFSDVATLLIVDFDLFLKDMGWRKIGNTS